MAADRKDRAAPFVEPMSFDDFLSAFEAISLGDGAVVRTILAKSRVVRSFLENLSLGVALLDHQRRYIIVNQTMAGFNGRSLADHPGLGVGQCPPCGSRLAAEFARQALGQGLAIHDCRFDGPDDQPPERRRQYQASIFPIFTRDGGIDGVGMLAVDVTIERRALADLRRSEEKHARIFAEATDGMALVDRQSGVVLDCNQALAKLIGRPRAEIIGRHQRLLHPPEDWQEDFSLTFPRLGRPPSHGPILVRLQLADGRIGQAEVRANVFELDGRQVAMGVFRDISERIAAQKATSFNEMRLETLFRLSQMTQATEQEIYDFVVDEGVRLTESQYGYLYLLDENETTFARRVWSETALRDCQIFDAQTFGPQPIAQSGLCAEAVRQRRPLIINDHADAHTLKRGAPPGHLPLRRHIHVPVIDQGRIAAVAGMANKDQDYRHADVLQLQLLMNGMMAIVHQRRAETALRESRRAFKDLVENLADIICRWDDKGRLAYLSPAAAPHLGADLQRLLGKTMAELTCDSDVGLYWQKQIDRVLRLGQPAEGEIELDLEAGPRIFNWRLFPQRGATGQVEAVVSIARDITDLRLSERNYRMIFDGMLDGFALHRIVCDQGGRPVDYVFLDVNPAFEGMTGLRAADILGKSLRQIMPQAEDHWVETYGQVALTGRPARFESYAAALDKHFEVVAFRPRPGQFACIFQDVTERRRAQEQRAKLERQLRQAQKMEAIGALAGGIAHDFNNILSAMNGYAELALEDLPPGHPSRQCLEHVLRAGARAKSLVRQILGFSRPSDETRRPLRLATVLEEVLTLLRSSLPTTIEIIQRVEAGGGLVLADPTQMHQVLLNLCTNAAQAMEGQRGVLELGLETVELGPAERLPTGRWLRLSVRDSGRGMDQATLARIFEPFFTSRKAEGGTGMGLAVAHGIVTSHGGVIEARSRPGQGSLFEIYLPALAEAAPEPAIEPTQCATPSGGETVLFVDDEKPLVDVGKRMLERLGYRVTATDSAGEALRLFSADPAAFDLLITDYTMPEITGAELAQQALAMRPDLPVILCTGYSGQISEADALNMGVRRYLLKPVTVGQLSAAIRQALGQPPASA